MRPAFAILLFSALLVSVYWAGSDAGARAERALHASLRAPQPGARGELEAALSIPNTRARALRLGQYFEAASPADLDATLEVYRAAEAYVDIVALVLFADWWSSFDPAAAFEHSLGWRSADADAARYTIVRNWAQREPAEARRLVDESRGNPNSHLLTRALVVGWAQRDDGPGVWRYLEQLPMGLERQKALQALIAHSFAERGADETLRRVEALSDDAAQRFKLQAYRRAAWALARYDPERAKRWAARHSEGPFGDGLLRLVGVSRAPLEGGATLEWLRTLPAGKERDEAVLESFRSWLIEDRHSAVDWLRNAEPDTALEPALVLLVSALGRSDPDQARAVLDRIQDPALHETAHVFLARSWMTHDREAALAWFETAPVSEEARRHILEEQPGMPPPRRSDDATGAADAGDRA